MPVDTSPPRDPFREIDEVAKTNLRRMWIGILVVAGIIVAMVYLPIF